MVKLDGLDRRLIQLLADDAWRNAEALAEQLNTSPSTVRRRVRKLVESGVLRIVALADSDKVGLPLTAMMAFDVAPEKMNSVLQMLAGQPEVKWVATTTGRFDILAMLRLHSTDELFNFVQEVVGKAEGIRNTETFICIHVEKGSYMRV